MVKQWKCDGETMWWNSGTIMVEQCWWNSGTVLVKQCGETVER